MPSTYFELMLREFAASATMRAALLEGTGVQGVEPGAEITLGQQLRQIRNLNAVQAPDWALRVGARFVPATHGAVGFAAWSAPTLAEGLAVLERFAHVRVPYFRLRSHQAEDRFVLRVEERVTLADDERTPLLEMLFLSLQGLVEFVLGRAMDEATIRFVYPAPAYAAEYARCFRGRIHFGAPETALVVPSGWLAHTSPMADPLMFESSLRQIETQARRLDSDACIVARVEQLIAASGSPGLSLAEAAARLHVSQRTLIRRLRRERTTYRDLLDDHRRSAAQALLRDPYLNLGEVCHRLGYGDLANFSRACRRWFGMAPRSYRQRPQQSAMEPSRSFH